MSKPLGTKPETAFNLKNLFDSVESENSESEDNSEKAAEEFSFETLENYWKEFLEKLRTENKIVSFNALQSGKLVLKESFKIEIEFNSSSLITEFEQLKERLTLFLREKLNNEVFELIPVEVEGKSVNYIKSKSEIFKEMAERNPNLIKLKNELGLDYNSNE
ncbi:MAG: hypothetical protein WCY16_08735 [Weeksellaceae bacterium]